MFSDPRESPVSIGLLRLSPALITLILVINRIAQYYAFTVSRAAPLTSILASATTQHFDPESSPQSHQSFLPPHMPKGGLGGHDPAPTFQVWFRTVASRIWVPVIVLSELQVVLCILNLVYPPASPVAWWLHAASLAFANGHWPFVPRLLRHERAVVNKEATPRQSLTSLQHWMDANNVRVLLVDVPQAFITAAAALASARWE
ncbi:hypothetical protein F4861DRAFT_80731 [Xylaria intraflava]|nr:hypothetical protein F4861DRAFT_80731 [Xylaria intraflava]